MKRILFSSGMIAVMLAALVVGSTGAFFSDTETSNGNTFSAGAIDLKIDNSSYYNGAFSSTTSWSLIDLTVEKFFNFLDLKPGDRGEDTISLHVNNNDAYLCANVALTSNDDNNQTEPESHDDTNTGPGLGELADLVNFVWWADDGDNVLEDNEVVLNNGPIGAIGLHGSTTITLADSERNIWTGIPGPAPGDVTLNIGKAWCFGNITPTPLPQDGLGSSSPRTPANSTGGIACDGSALDNASQTDSLTADVSFFAVQARNNPGFVCTPPDQQRKGELVIRKIVKNDNGGNNVVPDFTLFADDGFMSTQMASGATTTLPTGPYHVTETGVSGYVASFSGDCDASGNVTVQASTTKTCILTNDDLPANITLIKNVINNSGGHANPAAFILRIDGGVVPNNTSISVSANTPHTINEDPRTGYHFESLTGSAKCPAVLGGTATLDEGEAITCTITNGDN